MSVLTMHYACTHVHMNINVMMKNYKCRTKKHSNDGTIFMSLLGLCLSSIYQYFKNISTPNDRDSGETFSRIIIGISKYF